MPMLLYGNGMISGAATMPTNVQFGGTVGVTGALNTSSTFTTSGALTASSGIAFPATQAASADANTLDDYEEGSWTPTFIITYGSATIGTYTIQTGQYTKIGRMVYCYFRCAAPLTHSGANIGISGLPFTVNFGGMAGGAREQNQTGYFFMTESLNSNRIEVLRRYDNGNTPGTGSSVDMEGHCIYTTTT